MERKVANSSKCICWVVLFWTVASFCHARSLPEQRNGGEVHRPVQITSEAFAIRAFDISPDGTKVVYAADKDGSVDLYLDSTDPSITALPIRLTNDPAVEATPAFSSDGKSIVYTGSGFDVKGDLYFLRFSEEGSAPERLTGRKTADGGGVFSPDSKKVFFHRSLVGTTVNRIAFMDLSEGDGSVQLLQTGGDGSFPKVSPDGKRICYVSTQRRPQGSIFVHDMVENVSYPLTDGDAIEFDPDWSEDGSFVVFSKIAIDTNRNGKLDFQDTAVVHRSLADRADLTSYPLCTPDASTLSPRIRNNRLFFLLAAAEGTNCWMLPAEGVIGDAGSLALQKKLAVRLSRTEPLDRGLPLLAYYKVMEKFSEDCAGKAFGGYQIGRIYQQMDFPEAAEKVYGMVADECGAAEPEGPLSQLYHVVLAGERRLAEHPDEAGKREILESVLQLLENRFDKPDSRVTTRAQIESARLLMDFGRGAADFNRAGKMLERVLGEQPQPSDAAEAMLMRARLYRSMGRTKEIYPVYLEVVKRFPEQEKWTDLAISQILDLVEGEMPDTDLNATIQTYRRMAEEHRQEAPGLSMGALNRVGDLCYRAGKWREAKNAYRQVIREYPERSTQNAAARFALAELFYREEHFRQALELYREEMAMRPEDDRLRMLARRGYIRKTVSAAEYLFRLGEINAAESRFKELIEFDRGIIEGHRGYIRCAAATGQTERAVREYREWKREMPDNPVAIYGLALALTYLEDRDSLTDSENLLRQAIRINGRIPYFHQTLGYVLEVLETAFGEPGKMEAALDCYKKAYFFSSNGENPENAAHLLLNIGNAYFVLGQYRAALEYYEKRYDTGEPFSDLSSEILYHMRMGMSAFQSRETNRAVQAYQRCLASIQKKRGIEGPIAGKESAARVGSDEKDTGLYLLLEASERLALAYQECGRFQEGKIGFEQVFSLNRQLGNEKNLGRTRRNIAYNLYQMAQVSSGKERGELLRQSANEFLRAIDLVGKYGVPEKGKKEENALFDVTKRVALDQAGATQAAYGFSNEQEVRLAQAFLFRINLELGNLASAESYLAEQLSEYPPGVPISDNDAYGVSLLIHQAGLVCFANRKYGQAFQHFERSAGLCVRMESPVGLAVNVMNMAACLRKMAIEPSLPESFLTRLRKSDSRAARLLKGERASVDRAFQAQFHSAMGAVYREVAFQLDGSLQGAVRKMDLYQDAAGHFEKGKAVLEAGRGWQSREHLNLRSVLELNTASLSLELGAVESAAGHFEAARALAEKALLPDVEWRSLVGLNRYSEALEVLQTVTCMRAGCEPFEILTAFQPMVADLANRGEIEAAFNLAEQLSEMERFNRMAVMLEYTGKGDQEFFLRIYAILRRLMDLERRMETAQDSERRYVADRIASEKLLLLQHTGEYLEKLPMGVRMIAEEGSRNRFLFLLCLAAQVEYTAEKCVEAKTRERFSELRKECRRLISDYHQNREEFAAMRSEDQAADWFTLLGPEPMEAIDVMERLAEGEMLIRLFPGGNRLQDFFHHEYRLSDFQAFMVTTDQIQWKRDVDLSDYQQKWKEGAPAVYLAFEDPLLIGAGVPAALSGTHLIRSIISRKPFKRRLLALPPLPGSGCADAYVVDPAPVDISQQGAEAWDAQVTGAQTAVISLPVASVDPVPIRSRYHRRRWLGILSEAGIPVPFLRVFSRSRHLSLAVFTQAEPEDFYHIAHLMSFIGCPTVILADSKSCADPFLETFLAGYPQEPSFASFERALKKNPAGDRKRSPVYWVHLGYRGFTSQEADAFSEQFFTAYIKKGREAFGSGRPEKAAVEFENALWIAERLERFHPYRLPLLGFCRESTYQAGRIGNSREYAQRIVDLLKAEQPDSEKHAEALLRLGLVAARLGDYEAAVSDLEEAVEMLAGLELAEEQAAAMAELGVVLENAGSYSRAIGLFESAAGIGSDLNKRMLMAMQVENIARVYDLRLSQYPLAIRKYEQALDIYRRAGERERIAGSLLNIGRCHRLMGNFEAADRHYAEAGSLLENLGEETNLSARILIEQANNAWFQGRYEEAFRYQRRVHEIARKQEDRELETISLNTSGLIWWSLGNHEKAMRELSAALSLASKGGRPDEKATTHNNIGIVLRDMGKYPEALTSFDEALQIDSRLQSRWAMAYDLRNKARTLLRMGLPEEAVPLFQKAVHETRAIGNRINEAKALLGMGEAYAAAGKAVKAQQRLQEALELAQAMAMKETEWRALFSLARIALLEDPKRAENNLRKAVDVIESMRAEIRIEQLKESFVDDKMDVYEMLVGLLAAKGESREAFEMAERSRGRNFIDLLGNQRLTLNRSVDQERYDRQVNLRERIAEAEALLVQAKSQEERDLFERSLSDLTAQWKDLMLEIQAENPQLASFVNVSPETAAGLMEQLEPDVAILAYYLLPDKILCWMIQGGEKGGIKLYSTGVDRVALEKEILLYRRAVQNSEPVEERSRKLFTLLMEKMEPDLGGIRYLGIVPHGSLHYLSFASLFNGNRFLIEDFSLFYLPSASIWNYTAKRRSQNKNARVLAVGNPDLGSKSLDLPFAEHEVGTIRWNFPDVTVLTKERATEDWVAANIEKFGIIHLASHGEFDAVNPLFSAIKLSKGSKKDGDLEAAEVFSLRIHADMVVLSACQTGLGKVNSGDDVVGLNRAFFYAGTHTVLSSLWRVSDVATAVLIKAFYRYYQWESKADALRKAILLVKKQYPHPAYWAAFTLVGDYE